MTSKPSAMREYLEPGCDVENTLIPSSFFIGVPTSAEPEG